MIIARSPLRISLGGGGTDLPSYYNKFDGFVISAAINKYVYVSVSKPFKSGIFLKYSIVENKKKIFIFRKKNPRRDTPWLSLGGYGPAPAQDKNHISIYHIMLS